MRKLMLLSCLLLAGCTPKLEPGAKGVVCWNHPAPAGMIFTRNPGLNNWAIEPGTKIQITSVNPDPVVDEVGVTILEGEHKGKNCLIDKGDIRL